MDELGASTDAVFRAVGYPNLRRDLGDFRLRRPEDDVLIQLKEGDEMLRGPRSIGGSVRLIQDGPWGAYKCITPQSLRDGRGARVLAVAVDVYLEPVFDIGSFVCPN